MPLLQWGNWQPDTADYESQTQAHNILNVLPRGDGYGPMPSFAASSQALFAACRGAFYALKSDGSVVIFAGTSNALYQMNNTDFSWKPVSRVAAVSSISNANPAVVTYTNTFAEGEPVVLSTTGTLPTGLTAGTVYYVKNAGGSSFNLSATSGGAAIATTGAGSGTHSITAHYTALASTDQWQFVQAGNLVFVTQVNEPLQVFDLSSASAFSNSLGSPPQAKYASIVGSFLVLSGLSAQPYRIQWSGLGDYNSSTSWQNGTNSADFQDFPDGGVVRGVAGGEFGTIFQDQAIRRMAFVGGTVIFQIERVAQDVGLFAPYSIVRAGSTIFFYSNKGFQKIDAGGLPTQIGRERVDRTFFNDLDRGNLQLLIGAADPRTSFVYWAYKSGAGASGLYDKILGYDPVLDKFFTVSVSGEYLLGISQPGLTLENLNTISSSIDAMTLTLDAYANSVQPQIAAFSSAHVLGYFTGTNLEATMETAEQGTDGERIFVGGFRPVTDASSLYGSVSYRETQQKTATYTTEIAMNARTGRCNIRRSTRYARMKARIPAGTTWTYCAGVEPDVSQDGAT